MKTNFLKQFILVLIIALPVSTLFAQDALVPAATFEDPELLFGNIYLEDLKQTKAEDLYTLDDGVNTLNKDIKDVDDVLFAASMFALGAGLGFGNDQTLWCLHIGYYLMLSQLSSRTAFYGALGLLYEGLSYSDSDFSRSLFDIQLKLLMFTAISAYSGWHLVYGALIGYGFGSEDFDSDFKTDITRLTLAAVIGFHLMINAKVALLMHTNLFAYTDTKFKPGNGNDFNSDATWFLLNKSNLFAISLLINLDRQRQQVAVD